MIHFEAVCLAVRKSACLLIQKKARVGTGMMKNGCLCGFLHDMDHLLIMFLIHVHVLIIE